MLGLFAFFYALVHFSSYVSFDHVFDVDAIIKDIIKRPFITVGFAALITGLQRVSTSKGSCRSSVTLLPLTAFTRL